ncbi:ABC transporter substrate-binding protein, partial [Nostoc sp. CHAB 5715]|uniref:ABC transporter substrate-binding protein n=1 Tax=Nostoc sp. CHAB 5715 TaxID=2780400 RepID=UPI001E4CCE73
MRDILKIRELLILFSAIFVTGLIFLLLNKLIKPNTSEIGIKPTSPTFNQALEQPTKQPTISPSPISLDLQERMSLGERILVMKTKNPDKEAGTQAFVDGDFTTAFNKFQSSLKINKNDPEALIYKNNAQIGKLKALKVVISVPIGSNVQISEEMLRGVAQAQDEVNRGGGINGQPLQILIANDDAHIGIAEELAAEFVKDSSILAIIGHSRNEVSVKAAKIYKDKLVMVSTNNTVQLSQQLPEIGKYIFRIVPNQRVESDVLANYIVTTAQLKTITICGDSTSITSYTTKKTYADSITNASGQVITNCDFGNLKIPASTVVSQAISAGAEGLLLIPKLNNISRAFEVADANQGNLALFGHPTLYTFKTLQRGKGNVKGMVLTAFWHPDAFPNNPFSENANRLWGRVNWQTATSYDALQAIITGLRKHDTREGLQQALSDPNFLASGATGTIKFKSIKRW